MLLRKNPFGNRLPVTTRISPQAVVPIGGFIMKNASITLFASLGANLGRLGNEFHRFWTTFQTHWEGEITESDDVIFKGMFFFRHFGGIIILALLIDPPFVGDFLPMAKPAPVTEHHAGHGGNGDQDGDQKEVFDSLYSRPVSHDASSRYQSGNGPSNGGFDRFSDGHALANLHELVSTDAG